MNFLQAIGSGFRNYVNFSERASRSEFWWWFLFVFLASVLAQTVDAVVFHAGVLNTILTLALLLPNLAFEIRRLHDVDRSGWWLLISLTGVGFFVLLYWWCKKGTDGPNRFGPDPLGMSYAVRVFE